MNITPKFVVGRPNDIPEWVKYAAIDSQNVQTGFEQKPYPDKKNPGKWRSNARYIIIDRPSYFEGRWEDTLVLIDPNMKEGEWREVQSADVKKPARKTAASSKKKMGLAI